MGNIDPKADKIELVNAIIEEVDKLPRLLYLYTPNDGESFSCYVILGGQSGKPADAFPKKELRFYEGCLYDLIKIYKNNMMKDEIDEAIKLYKHIRDNCCYSVKGLCTKEEQREYITSLDDEQLEEIMDQIKMYKSIRSEFALHS